MFWRLECLIRRCLRGVKPAGSYCGRGCCLPQGIRWRETTTVPIAFSIIIYGSDDDYRAFPLHYYLPSFITHCVCLLFSFFALQVLPNLFIIFYLYLANRSLPRWSRWPWSRNNLTLLIQCYPWPPFDLPTPLSSLRCCYLVWPLTPEYSRTLFFCCFCVLFSARLLRFVVVHCTSILDDVIVIVMAVLFEAETDKQELFLYHDLLREEGWIIPKRAEPFFRPPKNHSFAITRYARQVLTHISFYILILLTAAMLVQAQTSSPT